MNANDLTIRRLQADPAGIRPMGGASRPATAGSMPLSGDFASVLRSKTDELKFSAHAEARMKSRNITLTPEMMGQLKTAVASAAEKGARDSLIMLRNNAFIVNIPNRTVVTAMDGESIKDNIFTNIDSAVIAG